MNTFKRKSLYAAVLAGLGAVGAAGSASAVQLSQDGTGQALIYPYYTVRTSGAGDFATYLNVVNTTDSTKAVKVRFLEGKNSREVLDFNLYLSPRDVWAGAISATTNGAKLTSADNSCVTDSGGYALSVNAGKVYPEFVNYAFIGGSNCVGTWGYTCGWDGEDQTLDRTREGYFEIIEMGNITDAAITTGLKHNSAGVPANCGVVANISGANVVAPTGGLIGGASLINVSAGSDFGYDPVVLEDFATTQLWSQPGDIYPDMSKADPVSNVFYYHNTTTGYVTDAITSTWVNTNAANAVSAVLARDSVMNSFILDTATLSNTDWVVTFPTKRNYVGANDPANGALDPNQPVTAPFHNTFWTGGSCDPIGVDTWDREEQTFKSSVQSSPPKPGQTNNLCWEANVITFKNGTASLADADTLLGAKNRMEISTPWEHGWAKLSLSGSAPLVSNGGTATYAGLPVVGFMVQDFLNTNVTIDGLPSASSYGGNFNHKYTRDIKGTPPTVTQ